MGKQLYWLALLALLPPLTLAGEEPAWPDAILALERVVLRDPRPGTALVQLHNFTIENQLEAAWRGRWEARIQGQAGAEESILLGWLDLEAGHDDAARAHFERATVIASGSYHAWLALAEMQLRTGDGAGVESIRKAQALAGDDMQRVEALRLPAIVAQEQGKLAAAWAAWKTLEAQPLAPAVRLAMMPDFARAHRAIGDDQGWASDLASAGSSSGSADDMAVECAARLALGDPAAAHRLATEALKKAADHAGLQRLAISSARAAGFAGEAAARIETDLGENPDDQALIEALQAFVQLGAPDHVLRLCRRHAAQLAPMATRWRELLPGLWRMGLTAELRQVFTPHAPAGGWELPLVLAEMAILEKDYEAASEPLWRVLAGEFDRDETASLSRSEGNSLNIHQSLLPLRGFGMDQRLREIRTQTDSNPTVFEPNDKQTMDWSVYSLCDGRDLALAYLRHLAVRLPGEIRDKILIRLREQIAPWPAEEKLLAWSTVESPSGLLDVAAEIADRESSSAALRRLARGQLSRLLAVPNLSAETSERLVKLLARYPQAPAEASPRVTAEHRWLAPLARCWKLFEAGKFPEADQAFLEALDGFSRYGSGPSARDWVRFHTSTLYAAGVFGEGAEDHRAEAASYAFRWIALQTPRRTDWPAPPRLRTLWDGTMGGVSIQPLFQPRRWDRYIIYGNGTYHEFTPIGGNLPGDLWPSLLCFTIKSHRESDGTRGLEIPRNDTGLPPESSRLLAMLSVVPALFHRQTLDDASVVRLERFFDTPDGAAARLLSQQAEIIAHLGDSEVAPLRRDYVSPQDRPGTIARASWIVGRMNLMNSQAQVSALVPLVEELVALPMDLDSREGARRALDRLAPSRSTDEQALLSALAGKLTIAHAHTGPGDPLPSEADGQLHSHLDAVEIDEAAALAKHVLGWPVERVARDERLQPSQRQAITALHQCGELNGWFSELRKRAQAGGLADWERLADQCKLITEIIPESPPASRRSAASERGGDFGQLEVVLRREAVAARSEAQVALVRLQPENPARWRSLKELCESRDGVGTRHAAGSIDLDTYLRGASGGLDTYVASSLLGDDPEKLSALALRWPVRPVRTPGSRYLPRLMDLPIARQLWESGRPEAATHWLETLFAGNASGVENAGELRGQFLEALACQGDRAGMVRVIECALRAALAPAPEVAAFPKHDDTGSLIIEWPTLAPIFQHASALGLTDEVIAALSGDGDPVGLRAALLLRLGKRDGTALPELSAWLERPPPLQVLEELSRLLAPWPDARPQSQAILRLLESTYAYSEPRARAKQSIMHAALASQCGLDELRKNPLPAGDSFPPQMLRRSPYYVFDALEALAQSSDPRGTAELAERIALAASRHQWSESDYREGLWKCAADGRMDAVSYLTKAFTDHQSLREPASVLALSAATHGLAVRTEKWSELTPMAWLKDVHEDGTSEVGWAFGWYQGERDSKAFLVPDLAPVPPRRTLRVEIFFGRQRDRLERVAVVEQGAPAGMWRGPLSLSDGFLAVSISAAGRAILSEPVPIHVRRNLLPPLAEQLAKLPALLWSKAETGLEGDSLRGVSLYTAPNGGEPSLATATLELPPFEGQELIVSGWAKGGRIGLDAILPKRREHLIASLAVSDPQAWTRIDRKIPAEVLARMKDLGKDARWELTLAPDGEYSGLRVTAAPPAAGRAGPK